MTGVRLEPAQTLLANLSTAELRQLAARTRVQISRAGSRSALVRRLTEQLDVDRIADVLRRLFPKTGRTPADSLRLDRVARLCGEATVQVYSRSRPAMGMVLLELRPSCLTLRTNSVPLFLENRWPVIVRDVGEVPRTRLYAGFIRPRRLHPAAQAAPPATRPYIIDEGTYGLRAGRLRFELKYSGPISFRVALLRRHQPTNRPSYLLTPIA
ncbi:MAG: hypothetical protein ABIL25_05610 [candidate division WOR-3 bacterium]